MRLMSRQRDYAKRRRSTPEGRAKLKANHDRYVVGHPVEHLFYTTRSSAKAKNHEFTITLDWLKERIAPMMCEAEGKPLRWDAPKPKDLLQPSPDRKDPNKGYTPENTRIVSWGYNLLKGKLTDTDVREWLEAGKLD